MDNNKVLSGTDGTTFINGEILSESTSTEIKVTGKFDEFSVCGENGTFNKFLGYSIEGTLKFKKVTSRGISLVADAYKTGIMPDIKIITTLINKATGASESTSVDGVVITEFMLAKFEAKSLVEEELPIKASSYEIIDTLN